MIRSNPQTESHKKVTIHSILVMFNIFTQGDTDTFVCLDLHLHIDISGTPYAPFSLPPPVTALHTERL